MVFMKINFIECFLYIKFILKPCEFEIYDSNVTKTYNFISFFFNIKISL